MELPALKGLSIEHDEYFVVMSDTKLLNFEYS